MAECEEWVVGEDGCLSVGEATDGITYHPTLNTILVTTKEPAVKVLDVNSGTLLQKSTLSATPNFKVNCIYLPNQDKVFFTDGHSVGLRRDHNGVLLLDTILQTPVSRGDDIVRIELPLTEAWQLYQCLIDIDLQGLVLTDDLIKILEEEVCVGQIGTKGSSKATKWYTVCLALPHNTLKTFCSSLVQELKKLNRYIPALAIASAISERLNLLLPNNPSDGGSTSAATVDRSLMYSESARRETFGKWPHMNYKWALPDQMAQAGFYHQPNSTGDDRAMCFTCSVCLVCWEPTDEPWSEHERHSPSCPFVKGEYTQNVPLSVTYATNPAILHGDKQEEIHCVSPASNCDLMATSTKNGCIVVWNVSKQLKKEIQFCIDPGDPLLISKDLHPVHKKVGLPKQAWVEEKSETEIETTQTSTNSQEEGSETPIFDPIVEIPLDDISLDELLTSARPTDDIEISSICIASSLKSFQDGGSESLNSNRPSLISGVRLLRRDNSSPRAAVNSTSRGINSDDSPLVQALNDVNEASSREMPLDIMRVQENSSSTAIFVPCILVYDFHLQTLGPYLETKPSTLTTNVKKLSSATSSGTQQECNSLYGDFGDLLSEICDDTLDPMCGLKFVDTGPFTSISNSSGIKFGGPSGSTSEYPNPESNVIPSTATQVDIQLSRMDLREKFRSGCLIQCVELPINLQKENFVISFLTTTLDEKYLLVTVNYRTDCDKGESTILTARQDAKTHSANSFNNDLSLSFAKNNEDTKFINTNTDKLSEKCTGAFLLYKLNFTTEAVTLEEKPTKVFLFEKLTECVKAVMMLPLEATDYQEEQLNALTTSNNPVGHFVAVTYEGSIRLHELTSLKVVAEFSSSEEFISVTYCSSIERICASSANGNLHFLHLWPCRKLIQENESNIEENISNGRTVFGYKDGNVSVQASSVKEQEAQVDDGIDLLVKQPLTQEALTYLHELVQFESLIPRFSATVPSCWTEIQQEQKQRRHPQHLQQQGEAMQHTRSWRLQHDCNTWDEHLFEITLPKSCCIGHIDFKFNLHPVCTTPPNIQITLLKQNTGGIGRLEKDIPSNDNEVDSGIDFNTFAQSEPGPAKDNPISSQGTDNPVLTPEFLIAHNAELLCGPLDISSYVDLSGQSGIVTLTSPELFAVKTRTFLIHLKAFINKKDLVNKADGLCNRRCSKLPTMKPKLPVLTNAKVQTNKASLRQQNLVKVKDKLGGVPSLQSLLEYYAPPGSAVERLAATAPNKKIDNLKGCDWFHEISITIRRTKRTNIPHERIQRCAMLESQCLQEKLIQVICGEDKLNQTISIEQRQHLALDILIWIAAIQMNKKSLSDDNLCLFNIQANLSPLIKSCFIDGTRSIAHKCAKLIIICLEHSKIMKDQDISPVFNYLLLQGLLEWLPSFPQCQSAGALRWLCLLLNRVKCLNVATVGQKCMELLVALSKQLNERTSPLHSLLRARFGLYGTPFEPELYDIEPPPPLKPSSTPLTYACVVASSNNANNNSTQNQNATVSTEELDLRGLLNIGSCDHLFLNRYLFTFPGQHLKGLLEVEPLHFTCHAASDGTKMEKIELGPGSGSSGTGTLPLSSNVFEQLPQYLPPPSGFTSWTGSLSSLFSTLKKKQEEFLKLQQQHKKLEQKLAETVFPNQANLIPFSTKKSKISPLAVQSNPYPGTVMVTSTSIPSSSAFTFHVPTSIKSSPHIIAGSTMNSDESTYIGLGENEEKTHVKFASKTTKETKKDTSSMPTTMMLSPWQQLLQPPPQQALVIERMHSGARRFVVLDFGKQILLTDLMIPSCSDLVSLSIDIWTQAEEIDGQRLVVTTDIGIRSLVMSDLQPPPVCRFLKITTIGRYGMNSTRCRIPIGTFYGHTFILPWELISGTPVSLSKVDDAGEGKPYTFDIVENQIQSQLNILSSLLEDIHCRYSLACDKLFNLLSPLLPTEQNNANHTNIYLQREKDKLSEEDQHIVSAYQDCLQLQQQLNLVTNTISRLERAQGSELAPVKHATSPSTSSFLKTICTDKLRVLSECLLDVLLGLTYPTPSIPQLPASLYMAFDQKNCETLFRFLCVNGTRRMQLNASTLLVRMCGLQPWWGSFVARMLVNLYNSEQTLTFPQDRVFILLTYLGQKSLTCSSTPTVLESVINLLEQLLMPLIDRNINFVRGVLDIPLIGWVLLFLSVCLDNIGNGNHSSGDDGDMKSCPKDKDAGSVSNRWDFIQGEVAMLKNKASTMKSSSVSVSSRLYRRKLQKRLMHHKQQLEDLEQAKKAFLASTQAMSALHSHLSSKGGSTSTYKELEAAVKQQEQIFKKALKQHSAKHFKDILQIRRTDGPLLTKTNSVTPNNAANGSEKEDADNDLSFFLPLSRSQTLPVAKGLVSLLLAMDFTCNVDMFLLACKVLGRISVSTRPAICLGEIFTQEQLSHLVQLCVGVESHANSTAWGGPWASHAITCLLQDILEGERLFPSSFTSHEESPTEEELPNLASGTDDSLQQASSSQLPADVVDAVPADNIPDLPGVVDSEDSESDECNWEIFDEPHPAKKLTPGPNKKSWTGIFSAIKGQKEGRSQDSSNSNLYTSANTVSTAVDARLEFGVEMSAEMRLKILTTLEADGLSNAICAPLQVPPEGAIQELSEETYETENSDVADLNGVPFDVTSSLDMLGQCFDQIFSQLQVLQINLESLLQLWLTLIEEVNTDSPGGPSGFDPGIIPVIPLSANAVSGLLAALTWYPTISLRTWCLAFQTLTLVSNLKSSANDCSSPDGSGPSNWRAQSLESSQEPLDLSQNWMGVVIVNDANLLPVLMKFLSGTGLEHGLSAIRNSVGPSVTQALHDFIIRLQLRCDVITPGSKLGCHLKELLLKLIHLLISNSGAIQNFHGPLDAQCKFIDLLQNLRFDNLDITIAMNVITATVTLVHNYIVSTERVICRSSIETGVNPSSCFGGLFAPVLRGDGKCNSVTGNRDMLVCSLLKLVNRLIQAPLLEPRTTNIVRTPLSGTADSESLDKTGMNPELLTDSTKIEQQAGSCSTDITVTEAQTDEHKTAAASNSHGTTARCNHSAIASNSVRTVYVADSVLQHQPTMLRLLSALASCTGSTMAMLLGSSGINSASSADSSDRFVLGEPVSVGDSVFHLLCTMNRKASCINLILQPIFNYMSSNPFEELPSSGLIVVPRLSEPLLWFVLKVLDCESALSEFLNMGGIQVICQNLVHSNHQLINSHPSFVSAVMQYLSNSRSVGQNTKHQGTDLETVDGLINFAPLGAISSSNPTAQPADVLIQAAPPHRRARTPAWSYHFYPEESWIDLTITLPCAVLLKEIHIQPHLTSLATCPSAVSVEVSRDGYTGSTPLCPPQPTNGLTFIRLQLTRPEIITSVTLRLHKPRDSSNIGLSQVLLLGSTTFGEAVAKSRTATMPSEDNVTRSSLGWLRILHHCLTLPVSLSIRQLICQATVSVPYLLRACCTLLLTPALGIYMTHIEHVLLQLGLHSTDVGLKEIDILLHSSGWAHTQDASQSLFHNSAVDSVVEIVYQLCITQDEGTKSRVEAVLKWLVNAAQKAIQQHLESGHKPWQSFPLFGSSRTSPAITFVQCVAAILWHLHETLNDLDLTSLISENMFRLLYEWSMTLSARSALKRAVDLVLCSLCYICPEYFNKLLLWMGILVPSSSVISSSDAAISDDRKNPISLTDDSKEAGADHELVLQDICCMNIEESHLMTLATVSQSPVAIRQLLDSGFLSLLAHSILDFCNKEALICNANPPTEMQIKTISEEPISGKSQTDNIYSGMPSTSKNEYIESEFHLNPAELEHVSKPVWYANVNPSNHEGMTDAAKAGNSKYCQKTFTKPEFLVSAEFVAAALNFFKEICSEGVIRDWLGGPEGNIFWLPLLLMLCDPNLRSSTSHYEVRDNLKTTSLSSQQRSAIEVSTLHLLTHCCWAHPSNQLLLSQVLCEVIRQQGSTQQDGSMGFIHAISGFTRRLILQLLLENEKIQVFVKSTQPLPKCSIGLSSNQPQHPRFGCGHHFRLLYISTQTTCSDIIKNVSDVSGLIHTPPVPEHKDEKEPIKKDITEIGLELVDHLSVAAGVTAKDKRQRDVKPPIPERRDHNGSETVNPPANSVSLPTSILTHELIPNQVLPPSLILAQLLTLLEERGHSLSSTSLTLTVTQVRKSRDSRDGIDGNNVIPESVLLGCTPLPTTLQVFASIGGLALLAQHLPLLYPEITRYSSPVYRTAAADKSGTDLNTGLDSEWVKVEATEDIYDDFPEFIPPGASSPQSSRSNPVPPPSIPPHSLAAFGLFLRLPGYAEVLLKERKKAQCLLRLALGITDNGEGGDIFQSPMASSLPTLPFQILQQLFDSTPLTTDDGVLLRRMTLEVGAIHLLLACLAALSHQSCDINLPGFQNELIMAAAKAVSNAQDSTDKTDDKSHLYWAKGTGFGTGSTNQSWDVEQAIMRQRSEEEHVTCLLQVLSSYINPGGHIPSNFNSKDSGSSAADEDISPPVLLPSVFYDLLYQSCLLPAISSYLRNDSVLDMARHVPLYRALLQLLRAVAVSSQLVGLLLPIDLQDSSLSVCSLLAKMKTCVDTYASRLKLNKNKGNGKAKGKSVAKLKEEDEENEGLAQLIPDIQKTARIVHLATKRMLLEEDNSSEDFGDKYSDSSLTVIQTAVKSLEERYIEVMKKLQFDTYEMIVEEDDTIRFIVSHHFESNMRASWDNGHPARARRLAQETVTLSTSLPLSFSSSVFVRCDQDRLDIMKVLITGPSDTPYANGCFEFDVYFPPDYPNSPMLINLETTGHHTVRFNPNLYNDGKVCLSVLNTWHGRPEEKWNPQTSSFLQVLVSIQSLILVSEPYFNEPGYERSRGSPSGNQSSREYDSNIRQANVKWAMLEQIRNPCPCFKEVIHKHFWMKRAEIVQQIDSWISEMDAQGSDRRTGRTIALNCVALKRHFSQLKEEFMKMKAPEGLEDFNDILDLSNNHMASDGAAVTSAESSSRESPDSAHVSVGPI